MPLRRNMPPPRNTQLQHSTRAEVLMAPGPAGPAIAGLAEARRTVDPVRLKTVVDQVEARAIKPGRRLATEPHKPAGIKPDKRPGTEPDRPAGTKPGKRPVTEPHKPAGTRPGRQPATNPDKWAGINPHRRAATSPAVPEPTRAGISPREARRLR